MQRKQQLSQQRAERLPSLRVEYVPPDAATIEQFVYDVCAGLVDKGRTEFASPDVRWRMTNLLKLAANLTVKQMNRGQGV